MSKVESAFTSTPVIGSIWKAIVSMKGLSGNGGVTAQTGRGSRGGMEDGRQDFTDHTRSGCVHRPWRKPQSEMVVLMTVNRSISQARAFEKRGDVQTAARIYESILDSHPGNARARRALQKLKEAPAPDQSQAPDAGLSDLFSGVASGQAADVVKRALAQQARYAKTPLYWVLLADAQKRLRQLDAALDSFRKAVRLNPDFAP
ncbi:MAG TPA: hypothetical protein DIW38_07970, partial [Oceanicaulis sp.]|nr:hypothetical protein [Oceanicaulis sp.]